MAIPKWLHRRRRTPAECAWERTFLYADTHHFTHDQAYDLAILVVAWINASPDRQERFYTLATFPQVVDEGLQWCAALVAP